MTTTQMELLSAIVREYDRQGEPVRPVGLATAMERDLGTVRECFESFESKHLLKPGVGLSRRASQIMTSERIDGNSQPRLELSLRSLSPGDFPQEQLLEQHESVPSA